MSSWWRSSRVKSQLLKIESAAAPAVLPPPLPDGAGNARCLRGSRHNARLRLAAGDLQHQLGTRRLDEFLALADRHHEGAGAADNTIFVVDIEVLDIHRTGSGPLEHDRQAVDGDAGGEHVIAGRLHQ